MPKYENLSEEELLEGLKQQAETLRAEASFVDKVARREFLPHGTADVRRELIESHKKIMEKLSRDTNLLYEELMQRWSRFVK